MAEIGLIASVVSVSGAGLAVAKCLYKIADAIGSAGTEMRIFATDTNMFSQTLHDLSEKLRTLNGLSRRMLSTAEDLVEVCQRTLAPLQQQLDKLQPLLQRYRDSPQQIHQLALRIQWAFRRKSKILFYRKALDSLKMTLACLLGSMNLATLSSQPIQNVDNYRMFLENSKAAVECNIGVYQSTFTQPLQGPKPTLALLTAAEETKSGLPNQEGTDTASQPGISDQSIAGQTEQGFGEALPGNELAIVTDELGGDPTEAAGQPINLVLFVDLLAVQSKVVKLAEEVLDLQGRPKDDKSGSSTGSDSNARSQNTGSRADSGQDVSSNGSYVPSGVSRGNVRLTANDPAPPRPDGGLPPSVSTDRTIKIKDSRGRLYEIPFSHIRTFKGMDIFLHSIYPDDGSRGANGDFYRNRYRNRSSVRIKPYRLFGPENQILLPEVWNQIVNPAWDVITMRFQDDGLNYDNTSILSKSSPTFQTSRTEGPLDSESKASIRKMWRNVTGR